MRTPRLLHPPPSSPPHAYVLLLVSGISLGNAPEEIPPLWIASPGKTHCRKDGGEGRPGVLEMRRCSATNPLCPPACPECPMTSVMGSVSSTERRGWVASLVKTRCRKDGGEGGPRGSKQRITEKTHQATGSHRC
jgi:hypothetical protein